MIVVMTATMMVILDSTIANVVLPHMQASLGATSESIAWVLTSYILASAVAIPVTGWLSDRFGRRMLFTVAIAGFTLSSALCGVANSLPLMVGARLLQGIFGAFMMPMSQAIMYDINPPERHVRAMTIWGMGVMVGPILGPLVGGWLTDQFDWRWVFFVNLPIGIVTMVGSWLLLSPKRTERRPFDIIGFLLLATALGSLQLLLDRGTELDWFHSTEIIIEAGLSIAAFWMFAIHTATAPHPLVPRALFRNRNLMTAVVLVAVSGGIMMAGAALIAPMMQRLLGYPVLDAGMLIMPRGLGTMAGMLLAGRLMTRIDGRVLIFVGMALVAWSLHLMTGFNLDMDSRLIITSGLAQGFGVGLSLLPMNLLAFSTLERSLRTDAASLYSLTRSLGGAVAISIGSALIARNLQSAHQDLGSNVTAITLPFLDASLVQGLGVNAQTVLAMLDQEVNRQALMIAFLDDFWLMMWAAIFSLPLILIMRGARPNPSEAPIMVE